MKRRGDGRLFQRPGSRNWWIQYNVRGKQYREAVGPNKAKAKRKLKARLKDDSVRTVPPGKRENPRLYVAVIRCGF